MKRINVLSKNVYNRIAAGEVIDRPYSAVKELIENSLDAGATEIEIYIESGGKRLIKVVDNGGGIDREDMGAAFMPHATSKILTAEDLDKIKTLGFRGEALASISVISKVELISVTTGCQACKVFCEDGNTGEVMPAALEKGTVICVRDLFYNTPVRAKFMKADKKEEADITAFMCKYILSNPKVAFKYFVDGKLALQSYGGGLDEAVAQVYGAKVLSECIKVDAVKDGIRIYGFIGNQNFFKPNKTYQSTFLNGRNIVNNTIATAINTAYSAYMMKRQYPFYVLNLDVPTDIVDVNVHPNKADVRFVDNKFIFGVVYSVISAVLDGTAKAAEYVVSTKKIPENKIICEDESAENNIPINKAFLPLSEEYSVNKTSEKKEYVPPTCENEFDHKSVKEKFTSKFDNIPIMQLIEKDERPKMVVSNDTVLPDFSRTGSFDYAIGQMKKAKQVKLEMTNCQYKGNLFNTYLLYELGDRVYLIDQHAAHERLIYNIYIKKLGERNIDRQGLLCPFIFETNSAETCFIEEKIPLLRNMGFGISAFGVDSFRIDEVPFDLQFIDMREFFDEILSELDNLKEIKLEEIFKEKIATAACKHAVKGGMNLTEQERAALFKMLDGNLGLKCPHGRPVCVEITKKEIEKMFKRIV